MTTARNGGDAGEVEDMWVEVGKSGHPFSSTFSPTCVLVHCSCLYPVLSSHLPVSLPIVLICCCLLSRLALCHLVSFFLLSHLDSSPVLGSHLPAFSPAWVLAHHSHLPLPLVLPCLMSPRCVLPCLTSIPLQWQ